MPGKCKFRDSWLEDPKFKAWIARGKSNYEAYCTVCKTSIDCSGMGVSALKSHAGLPPFDKVGKKHKDAMAIQSRHTTLMDYCNPAQSSKNSASRPTGSNSDSTQSVTMVTSSSSASGGGGASSNISGGGGASAMVGALARPGSSTMGQLVSLDKQTLKAEVYWALKVTTSHYSYKSCERVGDLFKCMFPDSNVAQKFACGESKCARLIKYGIAPHFKSEMIKSVNKEDNFVLLFDESLNFENQKKQLDIHVRSWDGDSIRSQYFGSEFMGHGDAETLVENFCKCVDDLNLAKAIQISMDGPNVNWKFHRVMQEKMESEFEVKLLDIGSCGLHILHGAFKTAVENEYYSELEQLYSCSYWLFKDSPARREDFQKVTSSSTFPIKFCKHRWLENLPVAQRMLAVWDNMKIYVDAATTGKQKLTKPSCKSYKVVESAVSNPMIVPMTQFYISLIREIHPFLQRYQCDKPMVPFIGNDLFMLVRNLMQKFLKPSVVSDVTTQYRMAKVDVTKQANLCEAKKVNVGAAASETIKQLQSQKRVSERVIYEFQSESQKVLIRLVSRLLEKLPIKYSLVRHLSCLDPRKMAQDRDQCVSDMKTVLKVLAEKKRISYDDCDVINTQFVNFLDVVVASDKTVFKSFKPYEGESHVESFLYQRLNGVDEYKDLWAVVKMIQLLSHGQASVERGFSVNKEVAADNLAESTFEARRLVCDQVARKGGVTEVGITPQLLMAATGARQQYMAYLEEEKRKKAKEAKSNKRKKIEDEIHDVKDQRKRLKEDIESMETSAAKLADKAEATGKLAFISQSNSLRRTAQEKKSQVIRAGEIVG